MLTFAIELQERGLIPLSIELVNQWSDETMTALYRHFYKALVAFSVQLVEKPSVAEDIVQDIFFQTWQKANQYKTLGTLKAYLYNSVRNESINYLRHQQVEQSHIARIEQEYREMLTDDFGQLKQHKEELYRQLFLAIDQMPAKQREVFLQIMDGKKNHEIAEAMQMSINTVKKLRQRGYDKLRSQLGDAAILGIFPFLLPTY